MIASLTLVSVLASHGPCGAALFQRDLPPPPARVVDGRMHAFGVALAERDSFAVPGVVSDARFAVRFGPGATQADAEGLLADINTAWDEEVDVLGFPPPPTADEFKFNVYVGDSDGNTPSSFGNSGYFNTDGDGYPMLVVALSTVQDPQFRPWVAAHELNHALQYAIPDYVYDGEGAWFFEASAEWAASVVHPDNGYHANSLGPYVMLSHLGVTFFDYADTGAIQEWHQYGAFVFLRYVGEKLLDESAVVRAWTNPDGNNDPMNALVREIEGAGIDVAAAFGDYTAANVTWDYAAHEQYAYWATAWIEFYPESDFTYVGDIPILEDDTPVAAPEATEPERFAYNLMKATVPASGTWRFLVDGEFPSELQGRVVDAAGGVHALVDGRADVALAEGDVVTLAIAAVGEDFLPRDRFAYRAGMHLLGDEPGEGEGEASEGEGERADPEVDGGGGALSCAASSRGDIAIPAGVLVLVLVRRRSRAGRMR